LAAFRSAAPICDRNNSAAGRRSGFQILQCKASAASAPSNLAEGFGRWSHRDFARFVQIAIGSLKETRDHLIDAQARGYITTEELQQATRLAKRANAACAGLVRYLKNSPDPS
jgi:four helix bundle protein